MERRLAGLAILIVLLLAACSGPPMPLTYDGEVDLADPNVGGGAGIVLPNETPGALPEPADLAPRTTSLPPTAAAVEPTKLPATPTEPAPEPTGTEQAAEPSPEPTNAPPQPTATAAAEATVRPTTHIVQAGENLYRIGLQYGISYVALAEYNGISNADAVEVGQELQIPPAETEAEGAPAEAEATATPTAAAAAPEEATPESAAAATATLVAETPTAERTHTVQPGENLYRISQQVGVNWALIAEANGLISPNQIVVGQVLKIPTDAPGPASHFTHQVHAGESLFRIALQYGVPLSALAEANGLQVSAVIYPGQILVIPGQ